MEDVSGFNPKRRLCPDGTCTGIIGPDGRCGECGRAAGAGTSGNAGASVFAVLDASDGADTEGPARDATAGSSDAGGVAARAESAGFDPGRRLCEDGTCVGVIGPTGVCTVCGRAPA